MAIIRKIGWLVLGALLLAGCNAPFGSANVEELLRAPQPSEEQSAVQKALNGYLGETLHLKYPRGGTEMSPLLFADLDGDGMDEAVVLYVADSKGPNVHLAVLENEQSTWEVTYEIEGLSTEVASVETAQLTGNGVQLLVGYATATISEKYLSIYDYHDETIARIYEQAYTQYLAADLDDNSLQEVILVPQMTQPGALGLVLLSAADGTLKQTQNLLLDDRFISCKGLYASVSKDVFGLVIDGTFSNGGLASEVLRLAENGKLMPWPKEKEIDVPRSSYRYLGSLYATDLGGRGAVEVPTSVVAVATLSTSRRFYFVTWQDFLAPLQQDAQSAEENNSPAQEETRFGVYDATYGYFMQLPDAWKNNCNVVDGTTQGEFQIRMKEGNALVMSARVAERTKPLGLYTSVASTGEKSVQLYFTDKCSTEDARLIRSGVKVQ